MKQLQLYLACHLSAIHTIQSRMFSSLNTYDWVLFVTDKILRDNSLVKNSDIWIVIWRFRHTLVINIMNQWMTVLNPHNTCLWRYMGVEEHQFNACNISLVVVAPWYLQSMTPMKNLDIGMMYSSQCMQHHFTS